jgi:hypothetical protein
VWLGSVLLAVSLTSPAVAQEDGVFVDPDSPTGKEYAIPLESVRRQADPSTEQSGSDATGTAPLFGTGIVREGETRQSDTGQPRDGATPQSGTGKSGDGASGGGADARADSDDRPSGSGGVDANPEASEMPEGRTSVAGATSTPGAPSGGIGTVATIGLLSAGALLIGGFGGVVLRRVRG